MQLSIVSASGNILGTDTFMSITLMTEMGEITVLPGHVPLLSAIRPGIMSVDYIDSEKKTIHAEYVSGGGVINIAPDSCTIVADVIESGDHLTDLEYIESQKKEAEEMMRSYRAENGAAIDPKKLIDLEYDLLRYTAMHRLGQRHQLENTTGARR